MWAAWWKTTSGSPARTPRPGPRRGCRSRRTWPPAGRFSRLPVDQVVDDGHIVAQGEQAVADMRSDEARSSGDQYLHCVLLDGRALSSTVASVMHEPGLTQVLRRSGAADTLYSRGRSQRSAAVGTWRSLVAHLLWEQGVGGSNPLVPTMVPAGVGRLEQAGVAQLVERQPSKLNVAGSNPVARSSAGRRPRRPREDVRL